jgi:putative inorganic carbon (HCO3(-)) transporter
MIALQKNIFILTATLFLTVAYILFSSFNFLAVPVFVLASILSFAIIFSFYDYRILMKLMIFSLPLSISLRLFNSDTSVIFPSEAFVGLLALIFFFRFMVFENRISTDRSFLKHPITCFVIFYFMGLLFSSFFSTMPLVSWKSLIVRFSYILVFYFMMHVFLKSAIRNYASVFLLYGFALLAVIVYAITIHASLGLIKNFSAQSVSLFYNDHTMYSAAIAFVIPAFAAFFFFPGTFHVSKGGRLVILVVLLVFFTGLYLSFCRAAWISVIVALSVFLLMIMKARFMTFIFLFTGIIVYVSFNMDELKNSFRQNKIDSNVKNAGFYEQTGSITNITSDVSNAERLNRWSCAMRMFRDKPVTGFGIGTYQFEYLSYQRKDEMTRISVISPYNIQPGHGGSTHSEYLLALSESGIVSLLSFIGLLLASLQTAIKLAKSSEKKKRITTIFVLLGLVTYFTHGLFNNFLDNDKLAFLFWSSLSMLATLDLQVKENQQAHERK